MPSKHGLRHPRRSPLRGRPGEFHRPSWVKNQPTLSFSLVGYDLRILLFQLRHLNPIVQRGPFRPFRPIHAQFFSLRKQNCKITWGVRRRHSNNLRMKIRTQLITVLARHTNRLETFGHQGVFAVIPLNFGWGIHVRRCCRWHGRWRARCLRRRWRHDGTLLGFGLL